MSNSRVPDVIEKVRRSLGRTEPLKAPPIPPDIDGAIARLAQPIVNLPELFVRTATEAKFKIEQVSPAAMAAHIAEAVKLHQAKEVGIPASELFDRLGIPAALSGVGVNVHRWTESTLDAAYDLDLGLTDVYAAVAETGSLVIRPNTNHGRALSLVPPIHMAVVHPSQIVPDLIDLFDRIGKEDRAPNITLITGPSKTADIEGSLVTGVHGPGVVQIFLLTE